MPAPGSVCGLNRFYYLAGAEASCAYMRPFRSARRLNPDPLYIGHHDPARFVVCVADIIADDPLFTADLTYCHCFLLDSLHIESLL